MTPIKFIKSRLEQLIPSSGSPRSVKSPLRVTLVLSNNVLDWFDGTRVKELY
jgi:hypothetical protein